MEFFLVLTQKDNFLFTSLVWTYLITVRFAVKPKILKNGPESAKMPKKANVPHTDNAYCKNYHI